MDEAGGNPLAYFITFTCYGTWLHGKETGSVDRQQNIVGTPVLRADPERRRQARNRMTQPPYLLDADRRSLVLAAIQEVCDYRGWTLLAAHVRTNHVHSIVQAPARPERVMNDVKAYAGRKLNQAGYDHSERKRWTRHGSTRYLFRPADVETAIRYVLYEQGTAMAVYPLTEPNNQPNNQPDDQPEPRPENHNRSHNRRTTTGVE